MKLGIAFSKIWSDDDLVEFQIDSSDGTSSFSNKVYVSRNYPGRLIAELDDFRNKIYGGIYDLRCGEFGPEYASGAFHARLHFDDPCKLRVSVRAQSEFQDFGMKKVASEATLYLISEPILLDNFISDLKRMKCGASNAARFDAVDR